MSSKLQKFFKSLLIVLADNNPHTAKIIIDGLDSVGIKNVITVSDRDEWQKTINNQNIFPDLIIVDHSFFDEDTCATIRLIRHSEIGHNPFVPIVGIIGNARHSEVMNFTNSGVDELLLKPFIFSNFLKRLDSLSRFRKPFIATMDYIGPDRRTIEERKKGPEINEEPERLVNPNRIEVTNSLKLKALNEFTTKALTKHIAETQLKIYREMLRGCVFQMIFNSVILSQAAVREISRNDINRYAKKVDLTIKGTEIAAKNANISDSRFGPLLLNVIKHYEMGMNEKDENEKPEFDLGASLYLIDSATELAVVVYQQQSSYRIIAEIRDSAKKYMDKFHKPSFLE